MKKIVMVILLIISNESYSESKNDFAGELYRITNTLSNERVIDQYVSILMHSNPGLLGKKHEVREYFVNFFSSDEYIKGKVEIYRDLFTAKELEDLVGLFSNPAYQKYKIKEPEIMHMGSEMTQNLLMKKMPELEAIIGAK